MFTTTLIRLNHLLAAVLAVGCASPAWLSHRPDAHTRAILLRSFTLGEGRVLTVGERVTFPGGERTEGHATTNMGRIWMRLRTFRAPLPDSLADVSCILDHEQRVSVIYGNYAAKDFGPIAASWQQRLGPADSVIDVDYPSPEDRAVGRPGPGARILVWRDSATRVELTGARPPQTRWPPSFQIVDFSRPFPH